MTINEKNYIEIKGVSKNFGDVIAVDNVDLAIKKGELFSILGASGSGKTTLLRILAGLETPSQGSIMIDGMDMTTMAPYDRPVNIMFQNYALFPHMSVFDNIAYGLKKEGETKEIIEEKVQRMLSLVKLEGYDSRKPNQLSGGQSQRVALARSLIKEPKVLLLDEPMAGMNVEEKREMCRFILETNDQYGTTIVLIEHDMGVVMDISDRVVVLDYGKIIGDGAPEEVRSSKAVIDAYLGVA